MRKKIESNDIPVKLRFKWRFEGEENEYIIYQHPSTGEIDILNPVATYIFSHSTGENTVDDLINIVSTEFNAPNKETVMKDIKEFVDYLVSEELMFIVKGD